MWRRVLGYGALLGAALALLQWLDYQRLARTHLAELYIFLLAAGFLVLGALFGARVLRPPQPLPFTGNPAARDALKLSPRELAVLEALAAGQSNKEIARTLLVSPNTVKTHIANLFAKLEVSRRTEAIARARALGIMP
jgi:DNA-binding CsgD family transcriptional regulator